MLIRAPLVLERPGHPALHRVDEERPQRGRRDDAVDRAHAHRALDAVDAVELRRELAARLRQHGGPQLRALGPQALALGAVGALDARVERDDAGIGTGGLLDVAREHDRGGGRAADDRRVRALHGDRFEPRIQALGEDHERAAVIARDDAEDDRPVEVHDGAPDLGAVLELPLAHRLRRAVEARQVGEHHERPAPAGGVDRAGELLRRAREQRARGPLLGAVRGDRARAAGDVRLDADHGDRPAAQMGVPDDADLRVAPSRPSARAARGRDRSRRRITERMSNGFLRPGLEASESTSPTSRQVDCRARRAARS